MKKIIATLSLISTFTLGFSQAFVTTWNTGSDTFFTVPFPNASAVWEEIANTAHRDTVPHIYNNYKVNVGSPGLYRLYVSQNPLVPIPFNKFTFGQLAPSEANKLITVEQWGNIHWFTMQNAFQGCGELISVPSIAPDLSIVTDCSNMFDSCSKFNSNISNWNTSNIIKMDNMFARCSSFNQPLNTWNMGNVTSLVSMFYGCSSFNQPLNNWNTSNIVFMGELFYDCFLFNQPLNNWNTSNVLSIDGMFWNCHMFNQPLNNWNTSNMVYMSGVFYGCSSFNQPLNNWNTSNVTRMWLMFSNCSSFNQPLNSWNTSNVENMWEIFDNAIVFNQNIGSWNIEKVDTVDFLFFQESIGLSNCGLSVDNYDSTIMAWSTQNVKKGVLVNAQGLKYCASRERRDSLKLNKNWKFIGDTVSGDETCLPLFVKFSSFTATPQQSKVLLQWQTATETNNNFFTVQRSSNKDNWQDIATVKGAGNSSVAKEYSTTDNNPLKGTNYYRIKQTDFNGRYSYSEVGQVVFGKGQVVNIYPNPAKDVVSIESKESVKEVRIIDYLGREVSKLLVNNQSGTNH